MSKKDRSSDGNYGERTKERAAFWRVSVRTMQKMLAVRPPWPVENIAAMIKRVISLPSASQKKLTPAFRRRIDELRIQQERGAIDPTTKTPPISGGAPFIADPDYADFQRTHADIARVDNNVLTALKTRRAFAAYKLEKAQERGDLGGVKDATEQLRYISGVIYDEETLAQKLGREIGDQIPAAELDRIARALPYWLLRCADDFLAAACKPVADASATGQLFPEEVRSILDPLLMPSLIFNPIVRALKNTTAIALPSRVVTAFNSGLADVIEDADAVFARLYPIPPPPPPVLHVDGSGI